MKKDQGFPYIFSGWEGLKLDKNIYFNVLILFCVLCSLLSKVI